MALLDGKRILVTGVLTDDSLAFGVARLAIEQGAEVVLTGAGRGMGLTQRMARRLPVEPEVLELDVTQPDHGAAGPIRTLAAKSIPSFAQFEEVWAERAPLGWDVKADHESVGKACVALLSDWFPKTTGEVVHVDGGFHAIGA